MYLVLEVGDSQIPARFPTHGTQDTNPGRLITLTGLSPPMACLSRQLQLLRLCVTDSAYNTTSPLAGIRFELCRFQSPLLTVSLTISLPAPTKMFQSGAFPIPDGINQSVRSSHSEIPGSKAPCAYPGHIAAWHVLHQRLSRAIRWLAFLQTF